jgi:hypothetical protein
MPADPRHYHWSGCRKQWHEFPGEFFVEARRTIAAEPVRFVHTSIRFKYNCNVVMFAGIIRHLESCQLFGRYGTAKADGPKAYI